MNLAWSGYVSLWIADGECFVMETTNVAGGLGARRFAGSSLIQCLGEQGEQEEPEGMRGRIGDLGRPGR